MPECCMSSAWKKVRRLGLLGGQLLAHFSSKCKSFEIFRSELVFVMRDSALRSGTAAWRVHMSTTCKHLRPDWQCGCSPKLCFLVLCDSARSTTSSGIRQIQTPNPPCQAVVLHQAMVCDIKDAALRLMKATSQALKVPS